MHRQVQAERVSLERPGWALRVYVGRGSLHSFPPPLPFMPLSFFLCFHVPLTLPSLHPHPSGKLERGGGRWPQVLTAQVIVGTILGCEGRGPPPLACCSGKALVPEQEASWEESAVGPTGTHLGTSALGSTDKGPSGRFTPAHNLFPPEPASHFERRTKKDQCFLPPSLGTLQAHTEQERQVRSSLTQGLCLAKFSFEVKDQGLLPSPPPHILSILHSLHFHTPSLNHQGVPGLESQVPFSVPGPHPGRRGEEEMSRQCNSAI